MNENMMVDRGTIDAGIGADIGADVVADISGGIWVSVNGRTRQVPARATLSDLIVQLGHAPRAIATAVNGDFIACDDRSERVLQRGDQVTCFQAIVGG